MNLIAKGTIAKPIVTGALLLTNGSLSLRKSGVIFSPIQATIRTSNKHWQAEGSISSGGHLLTLNGQGNYSPHVTGKIDLKSDNFTIMKTAEYMIDISPQLVITLAPNLLHVTGLILIPTAQLKPISFRIAPMSSRRYYIFFLSLCKCLNLYSIYAFMYYCEVLCLSRW